MRGRTCVICGGVTYAPTGNSYFCLSCWHTHAIPGGSSLTMPPWALFLKNQAQYEQRQRLREIRRVDRMGNPIVTMIG